LAIQRFIRAAGMPPSTSAKDGRRYTFQTGSEQGAPDTAPNLPFGDVVAATFPAKPKFGFPSGNTLLPPSGDALANSGAAKVCPAEHQWRT